MLKQETGAYTPGVLGVRHTPCETEHDVTFSRLCDQEKSRKSQKDNYVLSSPEGTVCTRLLVFEETFAKTVSAVVNCAVPGLSEFYSLFGLISQPQVCAIPVAHLQGSKTRNRQNIPAEPQTVFAVVTCAFPGLSVFYSIVVSIQQPWVCAIPGAHLRSTDCIQRDILADGFCTCELQCCRAECVLYPGFNVQSDIIAVMIAWSQL